MKTKCLILYGSPLKLSDAHFPVDQRGNYFVRSMYFNGGVGAALDAVTSVKELEPWPGEIIINTVKVPCS